MDPQVSAQITSQIELQMEMIQILFWFVGIVTTIFLSLITLFGYWIWDLNRKVGRAVSGPECEKRNGKHYGDVENLRLEIKDDSEKLSERLTKGLERSSRERDAAIKALEKKVDGFMSTVTNQQQSNFEVLVGVLRDIGCDNPKKH